MEMEKKSLRAGIRKELTAPHPEASAAIRSRLQSLDCWKTAQTILTYHPLTSEADLLPLLLKESSKEWIFPRIDGESLTLHRWTQEAIWRTGPFGILEPDPEEWPKVAHETIDLALIPALAFDRNGNRLGRGRGFYDRLLVSSGFRALKVGIVSERFLLPEIPTEIHDISMDLVVTESGIYFHEDSSYGSELDKGPERE
jgi:5-formyltetrahydrofolate cyclo-ligase